VYFREASRIIRSIFFEFVKLNIRIILFIIICIFIISQYYLRILQNRLILFTLTCVANAQKVLELIRNKSRRVNLALNPQLWQLFESCVEKELVAPTHKIEELIIAYLDQNGYLDE
jgi:hypothetical protein